MEQDIYKTVTVEQFKEMFFRDFPFLPLYEEGKTYWKDDVVYYTDENFYKSLIDDNTQPPTDTEAWTKIKGDIYRYVTDADIERAMSQAYLNKNPLLHVSMTEPSDIFKRDAAEAFMKDDVSVPYPTPRRNERNIPIPMTPVNISMIFLRIVFSKRIISRNACIPSIVVIIDGINTWGKYAS